jgi:L-fuconolactonase
VIVDSHAHVWSGDRLTFPFSPHDQVPLPTTARPVEDLFARLDAVGVSHAVLIQPRVYGYDHAYLTSALRRYESRAAGVCLVNPLRPDAPAELRRRVQAEGYAGLRLVGVDNGAAQWLFDQRSAHLWQAAADLGVVVSLLVEPHHLAAVRRVAATYRSTTIVIDHIARCRPGAPEEPDLLALADFANVTVKISALPVLSREGKPFLDLQPLVSRCLAEFGADRLIWGTDYPHVLDAGPYPAPIDALRPLLGNATDTQLHQIAGGNAARLYRLQP